MWRRIGRIRECRGQVKGNRKKAPHLSSLRGRFCFRDLSDICDFGAGLLERNGHVELIDGANADRHKFQGGIHSGQEIGEKGLPRDHPVLKRGERTIRMPVLQMDVADEIILSRGSREMNSLQNRGFSIGDTIFAEIGPWV